MWIGKENFLEFSDFEGGVGGFLENDHRSGKRNFLSRLYGPNSMGLN